MNKARPKIPDSSDIGEGFGKVAPGACPSITQQKRTSNNKKKKKKSTGAEHQINAPASDPLNVKTLREKSSEAPSTAIPKHKWSNKRVTGTNVMDSSRELSKVPPAMPRKRSPKKVKPVNVNANPSLEEQSATPLQTAQKGASKKKKKSSDAGNLKVLPITKAPVAENPKTAAPQTPSGSAGRTQIAKSLAQAFKAQQKIVKQYRSRKNSAKRKIFPFLNLPRELRDIIISYTINYDGIDPKISQINDTFPSRTLRKAGFPEIYQGWMSNLEARCPCTTPTIILLNHQIHEEAQEMLQKKTMRIANPPQYPFPGQFVLSRFISDGALEKVRKVKFELRTYPAKVQKPNILRSDWRGKDLLKDERLADSYPWAMLLKQCFELWRRTQQSRSLEISIDHCSGSRSEYNLSVSREMVRSHTSLCHAVTFANPDAGLGL
jgi:hypothetical protein